MKKIETLMDELIRDITRVGFMSKSEARRRMIIIYNRGYEVGFHEGFNEMKNAALKELMKEIK